MAGHSLESLLAWMKGKSRLLGWGAIVALGRDKTNLLLAQEYITRFNTGSYLPAISGDVLIVENQWMEHIHDFVLDVPLISFENADLNDSRALLSMAIMGGSQLTLKRNSAGWQAVKVDSIDPLQGPKLYLDLLLNQVPGNVDVDGRILLDLSQSDNFRLTFAQTAEEQRLGGNFFKDLFNTLPAEKRIYALGKVEPGTDELMRPQSFALRTQASGTAARDPQSLAFGSGAIVVFVRMEGSLEGGYPGADSGFKYLIPDDPLAFYSATVLFDRELIMPRVPGLLLDAAMELVGSRDFTYVYDDKGQWVSAIANKGALVIPGSQHELLPVSVPGAGLVRAFMATENVTFSATGSTPLSLTSNDGKLTLSWGAQSDCGVLLWVGDSTRPVPLTCSMRLSAAYELSDAGVLQPTKFDLTVDVVNKDNPKSSVAPISPLLTPEQWLILLGLAWAQMVVILQYGPKSTITLALQDGFNGDLPIYPFIQDAIKLNFGQMIQGSTVRTPHDVGFFGRIDSTRTAFEITPLQPLLKPGGSQQFWTQPALQGVTWRVENLLSASGDPGTITANGLYQAPPAALIAGRFTRVRVTATAAGGGYHSSALVTVVVNELTVNPLIQLCDIDTRVELSAGQMGAGTLIWSIKNKVEGESGEVVPSDEPDGDHAYVHGPVVANKTYVLDEIEVKTETGQRRSVHVLALQKAPGATLSMDTTGLPAGQIQLTADVNGPKPAQWSLPLGGPGSIDSTGLYQTDATATERFVLIFAVVDGGMFGNFEGHMIVPLPLTEFPDVVQTLSQ